jgi:sialidase-1
VVFFLCVSHFGYAQESDWKGFKRLNFKFENREARLVVPLKALKGNPWIWRARFPEYHSDIDSTLLAEGFHVAYVNTDHLFGNTESVEVRNRFYDYLIENYQLQNKVVLHGHSRGGLFTYNWAKKNPEKVACIYVDAPVCDFKSWPAGFGTSKGSPKDWATLKAVYGFISDQEAKLFLDNPIDNLESLAAHKVPILHTISLHDKVVPPEENTLLLIYRYIKLGGSATVMPCEEGEQKSQGHHYAVDDVPAVINFIKYHALKGL